VIGNETKTLCACVQDLLCDLQVMYDRSGGGDDLRKVMFNTFGMWHPFKQISQLLWTHFAPSVFAPLLHEFYPDCSLKYFTSKKLKPVLIFQTRLRLAYDAEISHALDEAVEYLRNDGGHPNPIMTSYLVNLKDLCCFFLPQVITDCALMCLTSNACLF
jgi:hypothetical protein